MATNPLDLSGRLIVISGGLGALGCAIVERLAEYGAAIAVNDIVDRDVAGQRLTLTDRVRYFPADVADLDAAERLLADCAAAFGRVPDAVCCHAGIVDAHPVHEYPLEDFDAIVRTNLRAAYVLARSAARTWLRHEQVGQLVFTSSWVQDVPWPDIAPYSATKAALRSLTRSFARELAPQGIRANAIAPGIVAAGMAKHQWDTQPDYRARASKAIPLGYLQPLSSVADAFLFLLSPLADYMTGSTLLVDGGCSLYPMDESAG